MWGQMEAARAVLGAILAVLAAGESIRESVVGEFGCGHWDGLRNGGGTDLRRPLTMVKMGEGGGKWELSLAVKRAEMGDFLGN